MEINTLRESPEINRFEIDGMVIVERGDDLNGHEWRSNLLPKYYSSNHKMPNLKITKKELGSALPSNEEVFIFKLNDFIKSRIHENPKE